MKAVRFEASGDFSLELTTDLADREVRVEAEGITDDGDAIVMYGWYSPSDARELASYLIEMADKAEAGAP